MPFKVRNPLGVILPGENDPRPAGSIVELNGSDLRTQALIRSGAIVDLSYLDPSEHVDTTPVAESDAATVARKRRRYGSQGILSHDPDVASDPLPDATDE